MGEAFLELIDRAFTQHRQWRETREASTYASWAQSFKMGVQQAISTWSASSGHVAGLLLKSLRDKSHQWWYFLDHPQVPPDNHRAERSLRLAVTKPKVAGGSRSWSGFRRSAILLSVIQSSRAQGPSALDFFRRWRSKCGSYIAFFGSTVSFSRIISNSGVASLRDDTQFFHKFKIS